MRALCLLCVALFIAAGCLKAGGSPAPVFPPSEDSNTKCGCLIVDLIGTAKVWLENSSKAIPATRNMPVFSGDELDVLPSSRIKLICGEDNKRYEKTAGVYPVPCGPGDRGPLSIDGRIVDPGGVRGDTIFPRLLSPRNTKLLDPHPQIRWSSVANVSSYTVRVRGPNLDWHTSVNSNEVAYPNDAPALVAGQSYTISIFADRLKSDDEGVSGLEFTIIEAGEAAMVRARASEIKSLNVDETQKRLLSAYLYASHYLNAEAVMQLDKASSDPETVRLIAELYLKTKLVDGAAEQYLRLLELAGENSILKARANHRLGQIYQATHSKDKASTKYEDALRLYLDLKNWVLVESLAHSLAELKH